MAITVETVGALDLSGKTTGEKIAYPAPGETLLEDFMKPLGLSAYALAKAIGVPANRITGIINGDRGITADTAVRLGRHFGTSARFWMNLQVDYELDQVTARVTA